MPQLNRLVPVLEPPKKKAKKKPVDFTNYRCLECVRCGRRHTRADILSGAYRAETMMCSRCYARMQQLPYHKSCFGKPGYVKNRYSPRRIYGYMPTAIECSQVCPDAAVCRIIVRGPRRSAVKSIRENSFAGTTPSV